MRELVMILLAGYLCHCASTTPVGQTDGSDTRVEDNDMMNLMQQDEPQADAEASDYANKIIEDIKARILKNLNRKEPPKKHAPLSPLQVLNFRNIPEINSEVPSGVSNSTKQRRSEFVYASVENATETDGGDSSLVNFHFDLPQQVINKDFESAELWLYKKENVTEFTISWVIGGADNENETETLTATVLNQENAKNWIRFNVSRLLSTENMTSLNLQIASEEGEWSLDFEGNKTPFLIIRTEARAISKRSLDCPSDNSSCCRDSFTINFADAGWGDWIIQPESYDAKICKGNCTNHYGLPWKHHGRLMLLLCQKNPSMAASLKVFGKQGGCVSCQPIEYQPTSFIYLSEDGTQVLQYMDGMVISKCGCL